MMINLVPSGVEQASIELEILNSDAWFNRISKDKEQFSMNDVLEEIQESLEIGAERFLIQDGEHDVGVMDYLMLNPNDGYPWLGLMLIKKEFQGKGYGKLALQGYEERMREQGVRVVRLGVLMANEPGHRFWKKQGFKEVEMKQMSDGKDVMVYEKQIG